MNPRIQKNTDEITRLKRRVETATVKIRELERQNTELENADIVALVRRIEIPPEELESFIQMYQKHRHGAVPDLDVPDIQTQKSEGSETEDEI